ncbi:MAG: magnesium transporter [Gammaproteobacteria bacterium]|jgi:magnesium transporter
MPDQTALQPAESRLESLRRHFASGRLRAAEAELSGLHAAEIALLLESLPPPERELAWSLVPAAKRGEVLLHVNEEARQGLIASLDIAQLTEVAAHLEIDDLADLWQALPEELAERARGSLPPKRRAALDSVLVYPETSAGGLMNTDSIAVRPDMSVAAVLRQLRQTRRLPDHTDRLFVVARDGMFLGSVAVSRLLTAQPDDTVADLMDTDTRSLPADTDTAEVARVFEDLDLVSAPVVSGDGRLLGRITVDDVVDVIRDQADHSLMTMAGLDEEDDMFAPVPRSARRRALWLGINLATAFLASWVVGLFQGTLQRVVALAVLMPVVASMGGIAGSQTLTLVVRGLALGQIGRGNARRLALKEAAVGALNGIAWAVVVAAVAGFWFGNARLAAVIAAAMILNLLLAALAGMGIPLLLRRLSIDPALAGTVVLTTLTDVFGFLAFLGLGTLFLR